MSEKKVRRQVDEARMRNSEWMPGTLWSGATPTGDSVHATVCIVVRPSEGAEGANKWKARVVLRRQQRIESGRQSGSARETQSFINHDTNSVPYSGPFREFFLTPESAQKV